MRPDTSSDGPDFDAYLAAKRIDSDLFRRSEPVLWSSWKSDFDLMHPNSFTMQKLNLINAIRRKYPRTVEPAAPEKPKPSAGPVKPVIRPKIK